VITQVSATPQPTNSADNLVKNDSNSGNGTGGLQGNNGGQSQNMPSSATSNAQLQTPAKDPSKKRSNFLCSIICCLGKRGSKHKSKDKEVNNSANACNNSTGDVNDASGQAKAAGSGSKAPQKALLPDPRPEEAGRKCIVIDLDETLVHSSFKPINNADFIVPVEIDNVIHQVYVLKRPYVDEFLCRVGELFECVLFTASLAKYADPVADLLDKWDVFHCRLFRESCVFHRGNYVKDLSRLGRELHKILIVDNSPASYVFHPDNAVPCSSWFEDMDDRELLDLIPLLEKLSSVDSVYSLLKNKDYVAQHLAALQQQSTGMSSSLKRASQNSSVSGGTSVNATTVNAAVT